MGKGWSEDLKSRIVGLFDAGKTDSEIASLYDISRMGVNRFRKRWTATATVKKAPGQGRKATVVTPANVKRLQSKVRRNPNRSINKVAKELNIVRTSCQNFAKAAGVTSKSIVVRHLITEKQKQKRVERSQLLLDWLAANPNKVILFTDETAVDVDSFKNRRNTRVLMLPTTPQEERVRMRTKNPLKVMAWGLVTSDGQKMPLIFFDPKEMVDSATYQQKVIRPMTVWIRERYALGTFVFMQNGAPAHTSNSTQRMLAEELTADGFWSKEMWPPSSPDLNPLDFSVWSLLKDRACQIPSPSRQVLIDRMKETWNNDITEDYVRKCCGAFPRRLRAVVDASGGHIENVV